MIMMIALHIMSLGNALILKSSSRIIRCIQNAETVLPHGSIFSTTARKTTIHGKTLIMNVMRVNGIHGKTSRNTRLKSVAY